MDSALSQPSASCAEGAFLRCPGVSQGHCNSTTGRGTQTTGTVTSALEPTSKIRGPLGPTLPGWGAPLLLAQLLAATVLGPLRPLLASPPSPVLLVAPVAHLPDGQRQGMLQAAAWAEAQSGALLKQVPPGKGSWGGGGVLQERALTDMPQRSFLVTASWVGQPREEHSTRPASLGDPPPRPRGLWSPPPTYLWWISGSALG